MASGAGLHTYNCRHSYKFLSSNVEEFFHQVEHAGGDHVHADEGDEHAADAFNRDESIFPKHFLDVGSEEEDDQGWNPSGNSSCCDEEWTACVMGVSHDGGDSARAGNDGNGEWDDHRFFLQSFDFAWLGEDHGKSDDEEEDAASYCDDRAGNAEDFEDPVTEEREEEENDERDDHFAGDDPHLIFMAKPCEHGQEEGDLTGCVKNEKDSESDG